MSLLVAGLGRCGTSLVMQMLQAGGFPVTGPYPSFEHDKARAGQVSRTFLRKNANRAVKILDPQAMPPGFFATFNTATIWCDRNPRQQAKSHVKFLQVIMGIAATDENVQYIENSIVRDRFAAMQAVGLGTKRPFLEIRFEDLILDPFRTAARIAEWLPPEFRYPPSFNVTAARSVVIRRQPECLPDMGIELSLIERRPASTLHHA